MGIHPEACVVRCIYVNSTLALRRLIYALCPETNIIDLVHRMIVMGSLLVCHTILHAGPHGMMLCPLLRWLVIISIE